MLKYSTKARQSVNDIMDHINSSQPPFYNDNLNTKPQICRPTNLLVPPRLSQEDYMETIVTPKTARTPFTYTKNISQISKPITVTPQKERILKETSQTNATKLKEKESLNAKEANQNVDSQIGYLEPRTERAQRTNKATILSNITNKQDKELGAEKIKLRQTVSNNNPLQFSTAQPTIKFVQPSGQKIKEIPSNIIEEEPYKRKNKQPEYKAPSTNDQHLKDPLYSYQIKSSTRPLQTIIADIAEILPTFSNEEYKREQLSNYSSVRQQSTVTNTRDINKLRESQPHYDTKSPIKFGNLRESQPYSIRAPTGAGRHHSTIIDARDFSSSFMSNDYLRKSKPINKDASPISIRQTITTTIPGLQKINFRQPKNQNSSKITPHTSKQKIVLNAYNLDRNKSASKIDLNNSPYQGSASKRHSIFNRASKEQIVKQLSIQDFQLGQCKGEGRFGKFYPAIHKKSGLLVGIKQIKKESVRLMLDQFIQQIKISLFLDHPNLVKMYGYFHDKTTFYIIMEYMEEGSLYKMIKLSKKLPENETAVKLRQICEAVFYMHEHDILHRDIKPENIVLTNGVSKLCDFGWATYSRDRRSTYCGTLDYVCPQILEGQTYDNFVDIWAIGVLAFEMLVGKAPFYHISRQQTIKNITKCDFTFPLQLPINAKMFIMKALQKNPDERFTIGLLLQDRFLSDVAKL